MAFTKIYNYLKRLKKGHLHGKKRNLTILKKIEKRKKEIYERNKKDCSQQLHPLLQILAYWAPSTYMKPS